MDKIMVIGKMYSKLLEILVTILKDSGYQFRYIVSYKQKSRLCNIVK